MTVESGPTVPLVDVPDDVRKRLGEFGASPAVSEAGIYRALANHPSILMGWIELAWRLRSDATTPRRLRELMIVRGAQIADCEYERRHHEDMALAAGVPLGQLRELDDWRASTQFDAAERAALELTEAFMSDRPTSDAVRHAAEYFSPGELVELVVTAALYCAVPRVVDAFQLPLDPRDPSRHDVQSESTSAGA